ncbi:anti-sigma factor antagonist [Eubacteriales bacterium OttesenSCG-928-N13]|nr:anti-sigma factor antagonist [Eubacteriales bacterium OttesenSCG-928-N13]
MLTHERQRATVEIKLTGELDHNYANQIRPQLDDLISDPTIKRLVFDLDELHFMDSSGIGMIIGRYKLMARRGGRVAVRCGNRQIDRIFEMAGLYQIIEKLA